ncbi:YqaJ viral recombinase family nuclease [Pseudoleptotrichia goodfellowii]|uniref:YqaJ viral recombinase family protein n=1 Tax=Pseudoleptotrichia goodfellowii TaxID=157692 RepID=A0A510JAI1_9FUSO|nr:YqaJ viral recombinase family protein [Pseudoleptotrichia goodfellowii]BBM35401.1 YqaJ viral recombinase family protein [Pseudoleptotrichia goodfellowii]
MQFRELSYSNKDEWHDIRRKHIGGSDISVLMGYNEYKNIVDLWKEKTGRKKQDDLSDNEAIQRGVKSEDLLIEHFRINNPEYSVGKLEKTLVSVEYSFMSANLDGVLENEDGEKGILEIKTATCHSYAIYKQKWKDNIPIEYYLQVQHYLMVTGWKYAILYADIKLVFADNKHELRQYYINRDTEDMFEIYKKEVEFYGYLERDEEPPYVKKLII